MSGVNPEPVTVAILSKAPVPGTVKTRLVLMLGVDGATELHKRFMERTVETAVDAAIGPVKLWVTPDDRDPFLHDLALRYPVTIGVQPGGDLGDRMLAACADTARPTLVVGVDCPTLKSAHLQSAAEVLRSGTDAVIIPSEDGGYVLIGLRRPEPAVFKDMVWSTDFVMLETRRRLTHEGLSWREPCQLWDVDRPTDVRRMRREGLESLLVGVGPERPSAIALWSRGASPVVKDLPG
jgi:rSAM/selenodomain-associated transferase 1